MSFMLPVVLVAAFLCALGATWRLSRPGAWLSPIDVPNDRSLHDTPKPRGGGLGVLAGFGVGVVLTMASGLLPADAMLSALVVSMILIAGVSYADDRVHLGIGLRLSVQFLAAGLVIWWGELAPSNLTLPGLEIEVGALAGAVFAVLGVVWLTNLFNFMDGIDGLAGSMSFVGLGTLAWLAASHNSGLMVLAGLLSVSAAGFLVWNAPPARIFMGDVGASTLGFTAAVLILWGDRAAVYPWWLGALVFGVFIADATVTLLRRAVNRERVWQAHRTHFYQRLVTLGWSHGRALGLNLALMMGCSIAAILAQASGTAVQWLLLFFVTAMLAGTMFWITALEQRRETAVSATRSDAYNSNDQVTARSTECDD